MKITLKKIQYSKFASEETHCFQADLYVDGKPFAVVRNDGRGGCDESWKHPKNPTEDFRGDERKIDEWFKANKTIACTWKGAGERTLPSSLESETCEVLQAYLIEKDVKSMMSGNVIIFTSDSGTSYYKYGKTKYELKTASGMEFFRNKIKEWYPQGYTILNDFSIDDAVKFFLARG
jgi:hypothetical protein